MLTPERKNGYCMTVIPERIQPNADPDKAGENHTPIMREFVPSINWSDLSQLDHFVQFYQTDDFLLDAVSDFIGAGLGSGAACIVIATPEHREALVQRLQANNLDPSSSHAQSKYFALDAAETLATIGWACGIAVCVASLAAGVYFAVHAFKEYAEEALA